MTPFQGAQYFIVPPDSATGGGYEMTFRIEVGAMAGMALGQCPVE
jgi:hypothetical protein